MDGEPTDDEVVAMRARMKPDEWRRQRRQIVAMHRREWHLSTKQIADYPGLPARYVEQTLQEAGSGVFMSGASVGCDQRMLVDGRNSSKRVVAPRHPDASSWIEMPKRDSRYLEDGQTSRPMRQGYLGPSRSLAVTLTGD